MKTTNLKERLIIASRREKTKKNIKKLITISITLVLLLTFVYGITMEIYDLSPVWLLLGIPIAWIPTSLIILKCILKRIGETNEEVLRNNKLINIIMSDMNVVSAIIHTYLCGPILLIIAILILPDIQMMLIVVLFSYMAMVIFGIMISDAISKYFKRKLSK